MLKERELKRLQSTACEAALAAGRVLSKHFRGRLKISEKPGAGLVTQVDFAAEKAALKVLTRRVPEFALLTEETHPTLDPKFLSEGGAWILDPLDGTTNFIHGFPMFCVSIGAIWNGVPVVGAIYHPAFDELYFGAYGLGARVGRESLRVSKTKAIRDSLLTTGFTYRKDEWLRKEMTAFEELSRVSRAVRRPGSAALDLAFVARGVFDGFWERRLAPWDTCAGAVLVQEAGGKVSNYRGERFRVEMRELLASNSQLHRPLLRHLS